jgi:hypothetical protein
MPKSSKIRVALVGGSGYAGFEAIRWLLRHPQAELVGVFGPPSELGPMEGFYPPPSSPTWPCSAYRTRWL